MDDEENENKLAIKPTLPNYVLKTADRILEVTRKDTRITSLIGACSIFKEELSPEWITYNLAALISLVGPFVDLLNLCCKCERMCVGRCVEYFWVDRPITIDKNRIKIVRSGDIKCDEPVSVTASEYCSRTIKWANNVLTDEEICPVSPAIGFPIGFEEYIKDVFKCIVRIFFHIYYNHFNLMKMLNLLPTLHKTCYFTCKIIEVNFKEEAHDIIEPVRQLFKIWEKAANYENMLLDNRNVDQNYSQQQNKLEVIK